MLKGNLSTRPFYNERLVTMALAAIAIAAVLLTGYDVRRLIELSGRRSSALAKAEANEREAARIRGQAQALQQAVDRPTLTRLANYTREANTLIEQRTFSWTGVFGHLEKTLPVDVRLVSISPTVVKGTTRLSLGIILRDLNDVSAFIDNLNATGAFYDVGPTEQRQQEDGSFAARIEASYRSERPAPAAAVPSDREKQQ
ncbi:MAG: hypothetical protein ABI634_14265 [Acidobacteriota bacterium]